jgi:hypothetical protein
VFFRRPLSRDPAVEVSLRGLDPAAEYELTFVDGGETRRLTGASLARLAVGIPAAPGSAIVTYRRVAESRLR